MAFADIFGKKIHYSFIPPEYNNGIKPLLLFLHEGLGSIGQWKDFPEKLCRSTTLPGLVFERNGYGRSEIIRHHWNDRYMHWEAHEFLPVFLETVLPEKKVLLVGHSDGGSISLLHASKNHQNILGVVSIAAHVVVEEITIRSLRKAVEKYQQGILKKALARYHGASTDLVFTRWAYEWLSEDFYYWNIESEISGIRCPLLAFQGDRDAYGTNRQIEKIKSAVPHAETAILNNCGHTPFVEQPDKTWALVREFIKSVLT